MIPSDSIIVIGRRFGSGARRLGKILAERHGLAYYDREILSEAAARNGFDSNVFAKADEKRPSILRSILSSAPGIPDDYTGGGLTRERIYKAQGDVIRELAAKGGAVFVGRSADYILRDMPHLVSIFLQAPIDVRIKNIIERGEATSAASARELARKIDKDREGFYNYFTGRKWGVADNYHITIDSSLISEEGLADMITVYLENRFKEEDIKTK